MRASVRVSSGPLNDSCTKNAKSSIAIRCKLRRKPAMNGVESVYLPGFGLFPLGEDRLDERPHVFGHGVAVPVADRFQLVVVEPLQRHGIEQSKRMNACIVPTCLVDG